METRVEEESTGLTSCVATIQALFHGSGFGGMKSAFLRNGALGEAVPRFIHGIFGPMRHFTASGVLEEFPFAETG